MSATLAILCERLPGEARVAATPDTVRKWVGLGLSVRIETGAGTRAAFTDSAYTEAGAVVCNTAEDTLKDAGLVLKVRAPEAAEVAALPSGIRLAAMLDPHRNKAVLSALAERGIEAYALEFVPRITRAQVMDVLSSQANLAGYRAVIEAAHEFGRAFPMMMTAAGTVAAARVFIMGAGVAGLQAIATARRLGAVVTATDVRPATKEQVESLGAKFVAVEDEEFKNAETAGGYAKEMSAEYKAKQAALISSHIAKQDVVITTALIPGRAAPVLVTEAQVRSMKPGSVLIDLAVEQGGNVEGARVDEVVEINGVKIVGIGNLLSRIAADASSLYAKNVFAFSGLLIKDGILAPDLEDEILKAARVTGDGRIVHPALAG